MSKLFKNLQKKIGLFAVFLFWFVRGTFKTQPMRWIVVTSTITLGISLAVAINIVNKSAIKEFNHSTSVLRGDASFQIKAKTGFFNELIFEEFLALKKKFGISEISPVLQLSVMTTDNTQINILGVDFFKVAKATPVFLAMPEANRKNKLSVFSESSIFLSPIAQEKLNISIGDSLPIFYAGQEILFTVAGSLSNSVGDNLAIIDISAFQSAFNMYGKLSRLDFKVLNENNFENSKFLINQYLSKNEYRHKLEIVDLTASLKKNSNLSKAYYVNLSVLALVALFTGMFLVYSVLILSVQQQTSQYALLRVMGATKKELILIVVFMSLFLSLIGSTFGVVFGLFIAKLLLSSLNANLGANLIFQNSSILHIDWLTLFSYWILGILIGVVASIIPAVRVSNVSPKDTFTLGDSKKYIFMTFSPLVFFTLMGVAGLLLFFPTYNGIPLASYISVALILFAFIGAIPRISSIFLKLVNVVSFKFVLKKNWLWLGLNRLTNTNGESGPIISSVVASFALTIAILIMVTSFKESVIDWLDKLLVADLYGNVKAVSGYSNIDESLKEQIIKISGIKRIELSKNFSISLDSSKANVDMIVRQLQHGNRDSQLFFVGEKLSIQRINNYISSSDKKIVIYASESMRKLYNFKLGSAIEMPFPHGKFSEVIVGGFYRDYSRQHGSFVVREYDFRSVTGKSDLNNLAVWLQPNSEPKQVVLSIKSLGGALEEMNFKSSTKIREISLRIFDQTFYVAYLLGLIALFISIFSIFCTYISQAKVREKEFSLLIYLGAPRRNILMQTSFESGLLCLFGVFWGLSAGICISLILIYIVNPQSFYWTMSFAFPGTYICLMGFLLVAAGVFSSTLAVKNELKKTQVDKVLKQIATPFV